MAQKRTSLKDLQDFVQQREGGVIYLTGEEEFFVEEAVQYIKSIMIEEASADFNYDLFYARETEASKIFDVVETLPMMAAMRLVIVRKANELRDPDWKVLMPALENHVPSTLLVLTGKKPDGRKSQIKSALKHIKMFEFQKPFDREYGKWIDYICKKQGLRIESDAISLCLQIIGPNLLELQNEIIKIGQYIGDKTFITANDVMAVASKIKLQNVFDLTKAIGECDRARALTCLAQLLDEGQNEVGILAMIHRHIRLLRQTRQGEQQGYVGRQLSSYAGVPHFFLNEYTNQARMWNERKIDKTYRVLADTDRALKSSPISSHIWLENFITQTCQ